MEEPEVDHLYSLPLDQFTQARDQLASRLKTAGDAAEATRIKKMRKPSVPAWAVNQLSRRYARQIEVLIAASDRLRRAQQDVLEGAPAGDLWEATLAEREAVGELMKAAEWILKESGLGASRAVLDRISDTLYAAAADPTGRSLLRRGLITHEMRRAGFGDMIVPPAAGGPKPSTKKAGRGVSAAGRPPVAKPARPGTTPKQILEAERALQRAVRAAERAEDTAERETRAADRTEEESRQASKRADAAARASAEAHEVATRARRIAAAARKEADRAKAHLDRLRAKR